MQRHIQKTRLVVTAVSMVRFTKNSSVQRKKARMMLLRATLKYYLLAALE